MGMRISCALLISPCLTSLFLPSNRLPFLGKGHRQTCSLPYSHHPQELLIGCFFFWVLSSPHHEAQKGVEGIWTDDLSDDDDVLINWGCGRRRFIQVTAADSAHSPLPFSPPGK